MAQGDKSTRGRRGVALGMCFGVAAGLLLGTVTGDQVTWLAVTLGLGISIGSWATHAPHDTTRRRDHPNRSARPRGAQA